MKYATKWLQKLRLRCWRLSCYTSIENLPIVTWFKIHETGDLRLLYKGFGLFVNLDKVWERIYNEFIKRVGLNDDYLKYLNTIKQITALQYECIINPAPINKATLLIKKEELKEKSTSKGVKYNEIIAAVSKQMGYRIDGNKVSVLEFYSYMKLNV